MYIVSLDGDEETHDRIRGKGVFAKIRQNISSVLFLPIAIATLHLAGLTMPEYRALLKQQST